MICLLLAVAVAFDPAAVPRTVEALMNAPEPPGTGVQVGPAMIAPGSPGWCDDDAAFPDNARDPRFTAYMREEARVAEEGWPAELRRRVAAERARLPTIAVPLSVAGGVARVGWVPDGGRLSVSVIPVDQPVEAMVAMYYAGNVRRCGGNKYPTLTFRTQGWFVYISGMCWHTNADWTAVTRALEQAFHPTWLAGNYCGGMTIVEDSLFRDAGVMAAMPPERSAP